jgi:hypothetical protein
MAPVQPAGWLQNRTDHPASIFRLQMAALLTGAMTASATSPGGGVHPSFGNHLNVSGTGGLNVSVDTGAVFMPGSTAWQGAYFGYNTASYTVAIATPSGSQWRSDYICARQQDTVFGDATDNWDIVDVVGTNSSSAPGALPTLPNNAVPLAIIRVTPGMTVTSGAGTVVDARVYAPLAGTIYTTSAARPSLSCRNGTMWYENDTNLLGVIVNGAYQYIPTNASTTPAAGPWTQFNPLSNSWAVASPYTAAWVRQLNYPPNCVQITAKMTPGTVTDGTLVGTLPSGFRPNTTQIIPVATDILKIPSGSNNEASHFFINSSGQVTCNGIGLTATYVGVNAIFPMDSL